MKDIETGQPELSSYRLYKDERRNEIMAGDGELLLTMRERERASGRERDYLGRYLKTRAS